MGDQAPGHVESRTLDHNPSKASTATASPVPFGGYYETVGNDGANNRYDPEMRNPPGSYPVAQGQAPFGMAAVAAALPEYGSGQQQQQPLYRQGATVGARQLATGSTPAVVYQIQQSMQYPATGAFAAGFNQYPQPQYAHPFGQNPGSPHNSFAYTQNQVRSVGPLPGGQYPPKVPYYYYADAYGRPTGSPTSFPLPAPFHPSTLSNQQVMTSGSADRRHSGGGLHGQQYMQPGSVGEGSTSRSLDQTSSAGNVPRGPPRKPKQSGHALWVGNLPPGATIGDLKDHFSREATKDIESVFLISKSNCAFVNYRSEDSCTRAMQRFHDSRFLGVRLVCRLRKTTAAASGAPTGPAAMTGVKSSLVIADSVADAAAGAEGGPEAKMTDETGGLKDATKTSDKYFIVKSLTLQDLEQSVRNGIWATQSHNETTLNKAFEAVDNVYLIFSANKSGEYYGYARMASTIAENASEIFGTIPRIEHTDNIDIPRTVPTLATESAPRGRIIDDSSRGTIFWEAERSDDEQDEEVAEPETVEPEPQTWGKPFKIEWMSTNRVPFYRTRGLRNPWNANREVKIARDGTELEPGVGKKLIQLFHRPGTTNLPGQSLS